MGIREIKEMDFEKEVMKAATLHSCRGRREADGNEEERRSQLEGTKLRKNIFQSRRPEEGEIKQ